MMIQGKGRRVSMEVTNYRHTLKTKKKLGMEMRKLKKEWHKNKKEIQKRKLWD